MPSKSDCVAACRAATATGLGALLALTLAGEPPAWAQNSLGSPSAAPPATPPIVDQDKALAALKAFGQAFSGPEPPQTSPASPSGLALMRQYMQSANMPAGMKAFATLGYDEARAQFALSIKALPAGRRAAVLTAFDQAFQAASKRQQEKAMASMAEYFATRMTDAELKTVVDFYSTGVGYKMLHGGVLTPEEREKNGLYMAEHPALLKFVRVGFGYIKYGQDTRAAMTAAFQADFRADLCNKLAQAHLKSANCLAAHT